VILSLPSEKEQLDFLKKIVQYNFTVRDAEKESREYVSRKPRKLKSIKDPLTEAQKEEIRQKLNTKVEIKKLNGKGQIIIEFYSAEELQEIINRICE